MVTVKIDEDELLEMLLERCDYWDVSKNNKDLFEKMYQSYIDGGCFEDAELNIMSIVDDDVVNWCDVLEIDDYDTEEYKQDFQKLLQLYNDGERDVSCEQFETINPSFIEAVSDDETRILIRY